MALVLFCIIGVRIAYSVERSWIGFTLPMSVHVGPLILCMFVSYYLLSLFHLHLHLVSTYYKFRCATITTCPVMPLIGSW